jgi:DNA adenine methylase
MKTERPIKIAGGKGYLADWIISHFPPHTHYVEPYFGSGAVLLSKPDELIQDHSEVANDMNGYLMSFWRVLVNPRQFSVLKRLVEATPFSEELWKECQAVLDEGIELPEIEIAYRFFILARQSREGRCKDFATLSKNRARRGMNEQVSAWLSAIDGLAEVHERMKRVLILCSPAVDVIRKEDSPNSFFYLDPPYLHETRVTKNDYGKYEKNDEAHNELLDVLRSLRGKFLLSGYRSPLYDEAARKHGWYRVEREIDIKSSTAKEKGKRVECLWANYPIGVECAKEAA